MWDKLRDFMLELLIFLSLFISIIVMLVFVYKITNTSLSEFWNFAGVLLSFGVGILSYLLSKRLARLQKTQMEQDLLPVVALESVQIITTHCCYNLNGELCCEKIKKTELIFEEQSTEITNYNRAIQINLVNLTPNYVGVLFNQFIVKRSAIGQECAVHHSFNCSTSRIQEQMIYLQSGSKKTFYLLFHDQSKDIQHSHCSLKLHLQNRLGEEYNQTISFVIASVQGENTILLRSAYQKPTKV